MNDLYAALSGSHAYGFPSATSDLDVRKIHVAPISTMFEMVGSNDILTKGAFGTSRWESFAGLTHVDGASYDIGRFVNLLAGGNAGMYEILMSPIVFYEHEWIRTLRRISHECACRRHVKHHLGLARSEWMGAHAPAPDPERPENGISTMNLKRALYAIRSLLAAIAVIESEAYTVDIQSLAENAALCDSSLDVRSEIELIVGLRISHPEQHIIPEGPEYRTIKQVHSVLSAGAERFFEEKGSWLPENVPNRVVGELRHILREIRIDSAKIEFAFT